MTNPISLQMYTLRDETAKDFPGTLARVAEIGYSAVELAGMGAMSATEMRALLDSLGLVCSGAHVSLDAMERDLDAAIADMKTLGAPYLICPWLPPERRPDGPGYRTLAKLLGGFAERSAAAGIEFCYHHHEFELEPAGDSTGLHILRDEGGPALLFEIDIYWAAFAGYDPAALLKDFSGRVALVHLKDMARDEQTFAEVGHGRLDIPGAIDAGEAAGAEWFIVEQDVCRRPPLESVKLSRDYLRTLGR